MQKITPFLWFDKNVQEASDFYLSVFPNSKVTSTSQAYGTPSGDITFVNLDLYDTKFTLMGAGPEFKFSPAVSFTIALDTTLEIESLWSKLSVGGMPLMELGEYPFSKKYGWIQDKYGLSWQIMQTDNKPVQKITTTIMYVGDVCGKTREAINLYTSVFKNSKIGDIMTYEKGEQPDQEGTIKHVEFTLENQGFAAMDSAHDHKFSFNESISFLIDCDDQAEVDYYWNKLSTNHPDEQCGWLKDKFGLSWQVVPEKLNKLLSGPDPTASNRVLQSMLKMKKIIISDLQEAYDNLS